MTNRNLCFIGGIHGVGKTHYCKRLVEELCFEYLSASTLLNWDEIHGNRNKGVQDVATTQDLLLERVDKVVVETNKYVFDGHFTLLGPANEINEVPVTVFSRLRPQVLGLLIDEPDIIYDRLKMRDSKVYDLGLIGEMQQREIAHAHFVSKSLGLELQIINGQEKDIFKIYVQSYFGT